MYTILVLWWWWWLFHCHLGETRIERERVLEMLALKREGRKKIKEKERRRKRNSLEWFVD